MNSEDFEQYDLERFHLRVAEQLGLSASELRIWMAGEVETLTQAGKAVGHRVIFRDSTPAEVLSRVKHRDGDYSAAIGLITLKA